MPFSESNRAFYDLIEIKCATPARWADNVNAISDDMRFVIIGAFYARKHCLQILTIALLLGDIGLNAFISMHIVEIANNISDGTMNLLRIVNKKPDAQRMFTEKYGTHQCALLIREEMMKVHHASLDDAIITEILKKGTADIDGAYLETVVKTAKQYTAGIFRRLREHEYDPKLMKLYVVGGGGCLICNFADYDESRVTVNDDICATAKGYERMLEMQLLRGGGRV